VNQEVDVQRVFRFAPSPNGYLHLGHAYSALLNDAAATACGGRFLLRLEDVDLGRCRPAYERAIFDDLAWLSLDWPQPVRRQSEHFAAYRGALDVLADQGLLYPCFCSRSDIASAVAGREGWPHDPDGAAHYPGTCKTLTPLERRIRLERGESAALRLDMEKALADLPASLDWDEAGRTQPAAPHLWGDALLARKDVPASYHIAVVVDDSIQGVTDVMRGEDLFQATSLHRLIQTKLNIAPPRYHHHRLVRDPAGRKLSKSLRAKSLGALRAEGTSAADIRSQLMDFGFDNGLISAADRK
jgi:glutamyl-Q tRNA(Asp) synthetase